MKIMDKKVMVEKLKEKFPNWEQHEEEVEEAINLMGMKYFDDFDRLNWQEQMQVLNLLQAISK